MIDHRTALGVRVLAAVGCTNPTGEFDGEATLTVFRTTAGSSREDGVKDKKFPVRVSVRQGKAAAMKYPQGERVLELKGGPFERCTMNVYDTFERGRSLMLSHEEPCMVSVEGYSGRFPGETLLAFVDGDVISVVANGAETTDGQGKVRGQLNVVAKRTR